MNNDILTRWISEIHVKKILEEKLASWKKLRVKFWIDPTGFDLTLWHAVPLRKLKQFQDAGHTIVLLFWNFTAQIGDPTGKSTIRTVLTKEQVEQNAETYLAQASKILDISKIEVVYNNDWLENMSFSDVLKLAWNYTVSQMLERDMFQNRIKNNQPINLVEFMYPLMQWYDSVHLKADVEVWWTDQLFNMMCGRTLQKAYQQSSQSVIAVPILVWTDGHEKMSKSLGNYIALTDSAKEMFGKTMSIPDSVIINYFELTTDVSMLEIEKIQKELEAWVNPRDIKIKLAKEIVTFYHSSEDADKEHENFLNVFAKNNIPKDMPVLEISENEIKLWDLVNKTWLCQNSSDSRRMIDQWSVKLNSKKYQNKLEMIKIDCEIVLQIGKRRWMKIISSQ